MRKLVGRFGEGPLPGRSFLFVFIRLFRMVLDFAATPVIQKLESYDYFSSLAAPAAALSTVGPEKGTLFAAAFIFFHSLLH